MRRALAYEEIRTAAAILVAVFGLGLLGSGIFAPAKSPLSGQHDHVNAGLFTLAPSCP
jgi:hypothetical protein